ncbi:MAG: hypothetical protein R2867_30570 [Caldilineaceae bacterium]
MKKVIITGPQQAALVDVPDPTPRANWVVVKVQTADVHRIQKLRGGPSGRSAGPRSRRRGGGRAQPGRCAPVTALW